MLRYIKKVIKQHYCKHVWSIPYKYYIDYNGNKVATRKCLLCGKEKKFY